MSPDVPCPLVVVIPSHGRPTLLDRTLGSLGACRLPDEYAETVVVENGGRAGAEEVVQEVAASHPALRLRYVHVERANKSHALNEALATIPDGLVVFFDDDVRLDPEVLVAYAEAAGAHPKGRVYLGGPVSCDYESAPPADLLPLFPRSVQGYELDDRGVMAGEYLGFNWAAFARDLKAAGGFDPGFGPGSPTGARGQESNMQGRLRKKGTVPVDVEGARVWHYVPRERSSVRWLLGRKYQHGLSQGLLSQRPKVLLYGQLLRTCAGVVKHTLLGPRSSRLAAACGLCSAVGRVRGATLRPALPSGDSRRS